MTSNVPTMTLLQEVILENLIVPEGKEDKKEKLLKMINAAEHIYIEEHEGQLLIHLHDFHYQHYYTIYTSGIREKCYGRFNCLDYKMYSGSRYIFMQTKRYIQKSNA